MGQRVLATGSGGSALRFLTTVEFFQGFQLLNQSFVLVFEQGHSVLEALNVLLLLTSTFARRLAVLEQAQFALPRRFL